MKTQPQDRGEGRPDQKGGIEDPGRGEETVKMNKPDYSQADLKFVGRFGKVKCPYCYNYRTALDFCMRYCHLLGAAVCPRSALPKKIIKEMELENGRSLIA
jgi:hypothetical protein